MLNNDHGHRRGIQLADALAKATDQTMAPHTSVFAIASAYSSIPSGRWTEIIRLISTDSIAELRQTLRPLVALYPRSAFRELWDGDQPQPLDDDIGIMRTIDSQQFHFLTEVNVGNWGGTDLRGLAAECGCEDLYRFECSTWSAATHNMWQHVGVYNLKPCTNPLHLGGHRVPSTATPSGDLYLARYAARYLDDTFAAFDEFRGLTPMCEAAFERLDSEIEDLGQAMAAAEQRESQRGAEASTTDDKKEK